MNKVKELLDTIDLMDANISWDMCNASQHLIEKVITAAKGVKNEPKHWAPLDHKATVIPEAPKPVTAEQFLNFSSSLLAQRGEDYDTKGGERSMGKTIEAFNTITDSSLKESEGWLLMQLLKDVRQWSKPSYHADSAEDCISYSALKAEALANE